MAKSLRSKWLRKCRAVKRERYAVKELARLKKTLGITDESGDAKMQDLNEIATVTDAKSIKEKQQAENADNMDTVDTDPKKIFNKKTLRNKHGNYPDWMSSRRIKKIREDRQKVAKKEKRRAHKKKK